MTFDQTILLIFNQICIDTNVEFDIIKKATKCATMFIIHTITNVFYFGSVLELFWIGLENNFSLLNFYNLIDVKKFWTGPKIFWICRKTHHKPLQL